MPDSGFYVLIALAAAALPILIWLVLRQPARPRLPYSKRTALLTPAKLRFYRVLREGVPSGLAVFVKVRLMDVVSVTDGAWRLYGAPGSGMHCATSCSPTPPPPRRFW